MFEPNGTQLVAGGFQPVEAYDVLVANLDPTLHREPPPETPAPLLERFPDGLTTQEVAALMAHGNDEPDRAAAEAALLELVARRRGRARSARRRRAVALGGRTPTVPPSVPGAEQAVAVSSDRWAHPGRLTLPREHFPVFSGRIGRDGQPAAVGSK